MDQMSKMLRYNSLLILYEDLLSSTQKEVLNNYYSYNLSISEIADEKGISRAAVEDAIKKGCAKLDEFENKLHLLSKKEKILQSLDKLKVLNNKDIDMIVEEIESEVK